MTQSFEFLAQTSSTALFADAQHNGQADIFPLDTKRRLRRVLETSGPMTALGLSRKTGLRPADVWDWASNEAAKGRLTYDPQTQFFALVGR